MTCAWDWSVGELERDTTWSGELCIGRFGCHGLNMLLGHGQMSVVRLMRCLKSSVAMGPRFVVAPVMPTGRSSVQTGGILCFSGRMQ
jgi:hypothetical protein